MEVVITLAVIVLILTILLVIAKRNKIVKAKIKQVKPWDEYLYQAYVELEDGQEEEILVFSKYPLAKNFKVVLERKGEKLFMVKKIY